MKDNEERIENPSSVLHELYGELKLKVEYILSEQNAMKQKNRFFEASETILANWHPVVAKNCRSLLKHYLISQGYSVEELLVYAKELINARRPFDTIVRKLEDAENFDAIYGTRTTQIYEQFEMPEQVSAERLMGSARYIPTPIPFIKMALSVVEKHASVLDDYVFIDVGSGMGRNLLIASSYPFKAIQGVEVSSFLCDIARENIRTFQSEEQRCTSMEIHCVDAAEFEFPKENMVLYFWEPFGNHVFCKFFERLSQVIKAHNLKIYLIFLGRPFPMLESNFGFERIEQFDPLDDSTVEYTVYVSTQYI